MAELPPTRDLKDSVAFASFRAQIATSISDVEDFVTDATVRSIGLFRDAANAVVDQNVMAVITTGTNKVGVGSARYVYSSDVNSAYVTLNPRSSFITKNGRGFKYDSLVVFAEHFGCVGDGVTNDTAAAQAAYDHISRNGGGTLCFGKGQFVLNLVLHSRFVNISGAGRAMTNLISADATKDVLNVVYREGSWRFVTISDIRFTGKGGRLDGQAPTVSNTVLGVGIGMGSSSFVTNDQYSCCTIINRCSFENLDKCIMRRQGQIALYITNCNFETANYHIFTKGFVGDNVNGLMHGGCMFAQWNHFNHANKAVIYMDSPVIGTGQVSIIDNVVEGNAGFPLFIKAFGDNDFVPSFTYARNWNEANYTSATPIDIEGTSYPVKFAYISDIERITFDDSPIGPVTLRNNTHVLLNNCDIKELGKPDKDNSSTITAKDCYLFSGDVYVPSTSMKMSGARGAAGGASWFIMPRIVTTTKEFGSSTKTVVVPTGVVTFTGTTSRDTTNGGAGPSPFSVCQDLAINKGETLLPAPQTETVAGKYYVCKYIARLKSGTAPNITFTGIDGVAGYINLTSKWTVFTTIVQAGKTGANSLYHAADAGNCVVSIGGLSVVEFDDVQDALQYANSPVLAISA